MKHIFTIPIIVCLLFASCSKLLNKEPDFTTPESFFNTPEDLQQALNGVYNRLIDPFGRMYSKGLFSHLVLSDEAYFKNYNINNIRVMAMDAGDLEISRLWEIPYEGINRANLLLENVDRVNMDIAERNSIKGEALFLRGYFYFILVDFFGGVPIKLSSTKSPTDLPPARSSVAEVYKQIISDMTQAEPLVHDIDYFTYNERVSKTAVQTILARVFLTMAGAPLKDVSKFSNALEYANKVIASGKHSLNPDYKQIFINQSQDINDSKECIWEVGMYGNKIGNLDLAGSVGVENGIECPSEEIGYSAGVMRTSQRLYDLFGTKDTLRRNWCIAPYRYISSGNTVVKSYYTSTQIYDRTPGKWRREYETGVKARNYNSTNFPVIRYSDVLLMKAEAENELNGPTPEAYTAINQVRRRAFGKPLNVADPVCDIPAGLDRVEFFETIQDERFREFCFEGMRKHDLLRWGIYVPTMQAHAAYILATAPAAFRYVANAGLNTTDRNVLFPIPTTEITINNKVTQTPGW